MNIDRAEKALRSIGHAVGYLIIGTIIALVVLGCYEALKAVWALR